MLLDCIYDIFRQNLIIFKNILQVPLIWVTCAYLMKAVNVHFLEIFWATSASKVLMNVPLLSIIEMVAEDLIKKLIKSVFLG